MSTERLSKDKPHKRSVDYGVTRMKTEADDNRFRQDSGFVEVSSEELRELVNKLRHLRSEKENLQKELTVFKRETTKAHSRNSVFKALA